MAEQAANTVEVAETVSAPAEPSTPSTNENGALEKLESILASPQYMEMMESCKNFNRRLLVERRTRVPFIDAHTGLAQSDCRLWFDQRHRMPGVKQGQVYSYPAKRWIKRRRQYLSYFMQPKKFALEECELAISSVQNPTFAEESNTSLNEGSKDGWFYEEAEIEREDYEDNSDASDFDFDDRYRKKKKSASSSKRSSGGRSGGSRRRTADPEEEAKKPWVCELCTARYKTRPGLTYHYAHSHKEERQQVERAYEPPPNAPDVIAESGEPSPDAADAATDSAAAAAAEKPKGKEGKGKDTFRNKVLEESSRSRGSRQAAANASAALAAQADMDKFSPKPPPLASPQSMTPLMPKPGNVAGPAGAPVPASEKSELEPASSAVGGTPPPEKKRSAPSQYCDFCLGDVHLNKKTGISEELVSCSDCGRSGHPTCLQFTDNMVISVKKYRWQCIECKCCSLCGTSDNDDQLLFCDDCDRGYHMYCLSPPLTEPPEGSWSCHLCVREFHNGVQPGTVSTAVQQPA